MNTKLTILALLSLLLISCGGGGGSSSSNDDNNNNNNNGTTPPQLTQVATQTLVVGSAANITITNTGGAIGRCTIEPDLPNNLNLAVSNNNCQITGIATTQTATVTYTITAINNAGESTTNVGLVVKEEGTIITDIPITSISISGTSTITAGDTTQLITTITPSNATNQNLIWSSSNEEVATVNTGGLVTALNPGEATITTAATDGSGITARTNITVTPIYITSISISGTNTITVGDTTQLTTAVTPNDASNQNLNWSSSNNNIATVNNTGLVTALNVGTATITATATDGSGITRSINITVEPRYITNINISGNNTIATSNTTQLTTVVSPSDATNQNLNWSSSNNNIATVNNTGLVTALNVGTATITATATDGSGLSADFVISVVSESVPVVTNFTAELLIDAINIGDTIGTITITNNPTTVTILSDPNGYDQHFNINADGRLTIAQQLLTITYTLQVQAANDFGTTIGNLTITVSEIKELAKLIATNSTDYHRFGTAVAIYNDYMLIGVPGDGEGDDILGYAYLFKVNETTGEVTEFAKLIANDREGDDRFGTAVALNDNYALIGADRHNHSDLTENGAAYLFDITNITPNTTITHTTKLIANDSGLFEYFGASVALNNNYALIGAYRHDHSSLTDNGAAYLFDITNIVPNTTINHTTKLVANDGKKDDNFGRSVALNNNYALIGANRHDHSNFTNNGAAYLFDITNIVPNTTITHATKLVANDSNDDDNFGRSVAIYNDYMLVGAPGNAVTSNTHGYAYLFGINETTKEVTQLAKLIPADGRNNDYFGSSVALNNNYALIGAYFHDHSNLDDNGAAYLFDITNIVPNTTITHTTKLIANDGGARDYFGTSVALNNNYALIGANRHDHSGSFDNGAAYIFGTSEALTIPVHNINITGTATITVNTTAQLNATVIPETATNQNLNWSSSNETVATVDTGGLVTALNSGEVTITAAATDGSGITRSINITVTPIYITNIIVNGNNTIAIGSKTTLSATITPNDAANQNLNWSSSNEAVATVTNGLVTALTAGTVTITATATDGSGVSATKLITITAINKITDIDIDGNLNLLVGATTQLVATVTPTDATNKDDLVWSSDNEKVATVDNNGLVTALELGTANIRLSTNEIRVAITVTVGELPVINDLTLNISSDTTVGSVIGNLTLSGNAPTAIIILEHTDGIESYFAINTNGAITINEQLTQGEYSVEIQATNQFGTSEIRTLTIIVTDSVIAYTAEVGDNNTIMTITNESANNYNLYISNTKNCDLANYQSCESSIKEELTTNTTKTFTTNALNFNKLAYLNLTDDQDNTKEQLIIGSSKFSARYGHQAVEFNNKLFVIGGDYKNDVWSSEDGANWTLETNNAAFSARSYHQAVVLKDKIFVIGGFDGSNSLNDVWSSTDGKNWNRETNDAEFSKRNGHQAVILKDEIFVIGGFDGSERNDVWSSANGINWTLETDDAAFSKRANHQAVVFQDKIYVIGGSDGINFFNDVWSSADGKTWTLETDDAAFSRRIEHQAVVFQDKMFVIGGSDGSNRNDVWSSADGETWTLETDDAAFSRRDDHQAVVFQDKIFVIGGNGSSIFNDVWSSTDGVRYNEFKSVYKSTDDGANYQEFSNAFSKRIRHQTIEFNNRLFVIGGRGFGIFNDVWSSADGKTWTLETDNAAFSRRDYHQAVVFKDKIFVIGGSDGKDRFSDVWSSADGKTWTLETDNAAFSIRDGHQAVVFQDKIFVIGGYNGSAVLNDVWSSEDGKTWTLETDDAAFSRRIEHQVVVYKNQLYLVGGRNAFGGRTSDVWVSDNGKDWLQKTRSVSERGHFSDRNGHQLVVFANKMFVIGGDDNIRVNDVWSSTDGIDWTAETNILFSGRSVHQAVVFKDKIFVIGGFDGSNPLNDVWSSADGGNWRLNISDKFDLE